MGVGLRLWSGLSLRRMVNGVGLGLGLWSGLRFKVKAWT